MKVYDQFNYPEVDLALAKSMGLSYTEYEYAIQILDRRPNFIELGVISAMWSEHCSYKSSKIHLKKLPSKGEYVVQGPGENAGIIEIDGDLCACFKVESHNHPSYIEPYQGAATGVGGILRDIFTMGARPVAALNSLRFGLLEDQKSRSLVKGVVDGIADYGNCFGVPTIGGEASFNKCYSKNPLVNAFALGLVKKDRIFKAIAKGYGNPIIYVGAKTGRDGIHGATMASESFSENTEHKRPHVQIGDPFKEKLLLEACLELMQKDYIVGIQDMGAAGLTSSSFEMAANSDSGLLLELDKVPVREDDMTPYEIMLSESQERMLIVAKNGFEEEVKKIFDKWDLDAEVIGHVTEDKLIRLNWNKSEVASLPINSIIENAPVYERNIKQPVYIDDVMSKTLDINQPKDLDKVLLGLLSSPNISSKSWIYTQYDHMVRTNTIILPGSDASMIRIKGSNKGIAISSDCNSRYCYLDPYMGSVHAVVESARNVAVSGARPKAITDCLNFGNPENEEVMWQFVKSIDGIRDACNYLKTPVVSGNVSFYNVTDGKDIYPTPVIMMVGVIDDVNKKIESFFKKSGSKVILLGENGSEIDGSEYLYTVFDIEAGKPPNINLQREKDIIDFMVEAASCGLVLSAHDISEGGLAVALVEMSVRNNIGADIVIDSDIRDDLLLFSEVQGRVILEVDIKNIDKFEKLIRKTNIPYSYIGDTCKDILHIANKGEKIINLEVSYAKKIYNNSLEERMN